MRIATWNVRAGGKVVENIDVLSRLQVDVALLQEANGTAVWSRAQVFHRAAISSTRRWASGVVALNGRLRPLETVSVDGATWNLHRAIPGALAVAEYDTGAGEPITLVCLYGLMENRWVYPTLLRLLADLSPLLYSRRRRPLILGGDFNAGATKMAVWARIYQPVWDTLAALGLVDLTRHTAHTRPPSVDCPCVASPDCGHLPTQRPRTGAQGLQVDQLWCTAPMLERLDRLEVRDAGDAPFGLSDHRPLIATFRDN